MAQRLWSLPKTLSDAAKTCSTVHSCANLKSNGLTGFAIRKTIADDDLAARLE